MALYWRSWLSNEGAKHLFLLAWMVVNVGLFWKTFGAYYHGPQYYYLHRMLGLGLCVSRASASVLNFNCSLVLLTMCRSLLDFLRGSRKAGSRKSRRLLDKSKSFHATCGITICAFSTVHVAAHMVNALNFSVNYDKNFLALNAARYQNEDPRTIVFTSVPGLTGILMVLVLYLMCTASMYSVRVSSYDIFVYTHNLFFVFYLLLLIHVSGGVLKYQTNLETHPPGCFMPNKTIQNGFPVPEDLVENLPESSPQLSPKTFTETETFMESKGEEMCTEEPKFQPHFPETWLWISGPMCLYCAERLYRCIRSARPVTITSVKIHSCNVIEVQMRRENFNAKPGQYITLHCPRVSAMENHPFTLTMCPTETKETFGIHLKVVGDWTERFQDLFLPYSNEGPEILPIFRQRGYPTLYVDGPFGSPSEEVLNYEVSLCVAGGIGVTPFAAILNQLLDAWKPHKLRRLYFVWVCRDIQSFHWFADLLCALYDKLWKENRPDYLNIRLFVSQSSGIQEIIGEKYQMLNSRLFIGRPQWKLLFDEIAKCNREKTVGVFCCGPKEISKTLHKLSNRKHLFGARFEYNKESFS